jgi:hypothetical protein
MRGKLLLLPLLVVLLALAGVATWMLFGGQRPPAPAVHTEYAAVLLANGSVFFGKLEGLGTPYPVLRDAYYVQSSVNQETKVVTSTIVKRGHEWHEPDYMILNHHAIVFVEPVHPFSRVARSINELGGRK